MRARATHFHLCDLGVFGVQCTLQLLGVGVDVRHAAPQGHHAAGHLHALCGLVQRQGEALLGKQQLRARV